MLKILPILYAQIMLKLCALFLVLLINLQLWVHKKWLNNIFALQNIHVTEKIDIL